MRALRTATKKQVDQLTELAKDYEEKMESLHADQKRVEESVDTLEKNFDSVKSVMQDRIGDAEDKKGQSQSQQAILANKHVEIETKLHEELRRVEATFLETVKSTVDTGPWSNSTATNCTSICFHYCFAVSLESEAGGARAEEGRNLKNVRPSPFDGKSSWEAYQTQFRLLEELDHWTEPEKAAHLAISLRGSALMVLTSLPEEQCNNFSTLSAALKNQFGNNHQAELNRAHLHGCLKRRDETLSELVEDIERLTRLAYPEAAEVMVIVLAKDQFIDALPDDDMRLRIRQSRPPSL